MAAAEGTLQRELSTEEALGACAGASWRAAVRARCTAHPLLARRLERRARGAADALRHIHAELRKCAVMEPVYWQRREGAPGAPRRAPSPLRAPPLTNAPAERSGPGEPARGREQLDV